MIETFRAVLNNNTPTQWITAAAILVVGSLIVTLLRRRSIVLAFFRRRTERGDAFLAPFIVDQYLHTLIPVLYFVTLYAALKGLSLTPGLQHGLDLLEGAIIVYAVFRLLVALATFFIDRYAAAQDVGSPGSGRRIRVLVPIVRFGLWAIGIVFLLENFGFRVEAILTGLGIGGVAAALAAQSQLKDGFGYFAIAFDRPFDIGDVIATDSLVGTVEYIGLRSTRIRSSSGELIVLTNSDVSASRIRNWRRMPERRIVFTFTLSADTPAGEAAIVADLAREAVEAQPDTRFDRAHFASFANAGLGFEVVYFVLSPDSKLYMDRQQAINLALKAALDQRGIKLASPTQALVLRDDAADLRERAVSDASVEQAVGAGMGAAVVVRAAESARQDQG
jgi:small-conductance mechanosensitive channel